MKIRENLKLNLQIIKIILALFLLSWTMITSSCAITNSMWNKHYDEELHDFLTTKDGKKVVFIAKNYHYIFNDNSGFIKKLLFWKRRNILYIDLNKTKLEVDKDNNVKGYVTVKSVFVELLRPDYVFLQSIGFRVDEDEKLSIRLNLSGKRYLPNKNIRYTFKLNNEYRFQVQYPPNQLTKIALVAATPITMALDATLWIGKNVLLAPFKD